MSYCFRRCFLENGNYCVVECFHEFGHVSASLRHHLDIAGHAIADVTVGCANQFSGNKKIIKCLF